MVAEAASKVLHNQINDPEYFNRQVDAGIALKKKMKVLLGQQSETVELAEVDLTKVKDQNFVDSITNAANLDVESKKVVYDATLNPASSTTESISSNINKFRSNGLDNMLDSYSDLINS